MNNTRYAEKLSNGSWLEITEEQAMEILKLAVNYQTKILADRFPERQPEFTTVDEAQDRLIEKGSLKYDDEWYATLAAKQGETKQAEAPEYQRKLDCGHIVYDRTHIMQTSYSGTACPDCYDMIEERGYVRK